MNRRRQPVNVEMLGFYTMSAAVIGLLIVVAVLHIELQHLRAATREPVVGVQLPTLSEGR